VMKTMVYGVCDFLFQRHVASFGREGGCMHACRT
jgi:hypothetical protein